MSLFTNVVDALRNCRDPTTFPLNCPDEEVLRTIIDQCHECLGLMQYGPQKSQPEAKVARTIHTGVG